jgi:hypothetical protein
MFFQTCATKQHMYYFSLQRKMNEKFFHHKGLKKQGFHSIKLLRDKIKKGIHHGNKGKD